MARSRNLKPAFFLDDELAEHEPLTRILFAGLWCVADRAGRLRDRPKRIKAEVLPYDDFDVHAALNALNKTGFIERYKVENREYIQILNFEKHQNPHCKEVDSTIPAPCKHRAKTALTLNPLTSNLNPLSVTDKFDEWWEAYDKKVDKKKCVAKWKKLDWQKLKITPDTLIADTQNRHANCRKWIKGYQPNPTTYLNGERWNDEIESSKRGGHGTGKTTVSPATANKQAAKDYFRGRGESDRNPVAEND